MLKEATIRRIDIHGFIMKGCGLMSIFRGKQKKLSWQLTQLKESERKLLHPWQ